MSNYYKERRKAFMKLETLIDSARKNKTEMDINLILFELTKLFEIGENTILKRLNLIKEITKDFDIIGNNLIWK